MEWLRTSRTSKCSGRLPQNSGRSTCYGPKLAVADRRAGTSIIAGMMCGADCIGDADVLRAGGTPRVFDEVYAPSTLGIFIREVHQRHVALRPGPRARRAQHHKGHLAECGACMATGQAHQRRVDRRGEHAVESGAGLGRK